ncbi:MAG TPA: SDR family oxidoreductase [Candidatus Rhabdochlamydia sp.]|jgi:NAD(P)-dependent dehydrogenase (short-subunit alcohol dehydrogenase family)|nr:SDR family oxidoreductase [Candidatus Rhabdochlamydia sp.]
MKKKVILLTGASSGIGLGILEKLSKEGCYLILGTYYNHRKRAEHMINGNPEIELIHADFSQENFDYQKLIDYAIKRFGNLHAIIHSAAEVTSITLHEIQSNDFDRTIKINLKAPFFLSKFAIEAAERKKIDLASIVMISSVSEKYAWPGLACYEMSKAALSMATRSLAFHAAKQRICVNAVAPGAIEVERSKQDPKWDKTFIDQLIPMQHVGDVSEVADVVKFLLTNESRYVTGQVIYVDGGLSLRL